MTTYSNAGCSLNPSTTTTLLVTCAYQYIYPPLYQLPNQYGFYYVTTQCASGPTAAPTGAPSGPSPNPTATPTVAPTQVAQATGYVSQYVYDTSTCSGVPNSITAYSLGVCLYIGYYHIMYSASVEATSITLTMGFYTNAACSVFSSSTLYRLVKACSSGTSFNYSTTSPVAPLSMVTRYLIIFIEGILLTHVLVFTGTCFNKMHYAWQYCDTMSHSSLLFRFFYVHLGWHLY